MPRTISHAKLENATARRRLKAGRQPHWQTLIPGKAHLGWQRWPDDPAGRWLLRTYAGEGAYSVIEIGKADDLSAPDGQHVLDFSQAQARARAATGAPGRGKVARLTVRQAFERYVEHQSAQGKPVSDLLSRGRAHILPALGGKVVEELEASQLRKWLATLAAQPAQMRPTSEGELRWQATPRTEDDKRKRMASSNRVLGMLKAMLNHAFDEGHVSDATAWGRKLKPFRNVDRARVRYLEVEEAKRLLNACEPDFRALVRAGLETGCRYGELARLQVGDFNKASGTVTIGKSKTGKVRHVVLTEDGVSFFKSVCIGREAGELIYVKANGQPWAKSEQKRKIDAACAAARIKPKISFHVLRHSWASLAVMNGMPLMVVAKNLGHADTRMVEKHYGHLSPSFIADAIRAAAPRFGKVTDAKVVALK